MPRTATKEAEHSKRPRGVVYDSFARFFENPTLADLRTLLRENLGELNSVDFKSEWPDPPVLAKHLLAIGNHGGGCIVMGVQEQDDKRLDPIGLSELRDSADLMQGLRRYLPSSLMDDITVLQFVYSDSEYVALKGKSFQAVLVEPDLEHSPFVSQGEGTGISAATVYVRRGTASVPADHDELQRVLNARIATTYSTAREISLEEHLEQLNILYGKIPQSHTRVSPQFRSMIHSLRQSAIFGGTEVVRNPDYPEESYTQFIARCIQKKKDRIEGELDI